MRTTNQGKKIQMPVSQKTEQGTTVDVEKEQHEQHVKKLIYDWSVEKEFGVPILASEVAQAISNFSDLQLQMPWELYKSICAKTIETFNRGELVEYVHFTYHETNALLQIMSMCSAEQMKMSLSAYLKYKENLFDIGEVYNKSLEANKERIRKENPYVQAAGEA